MAHSTTRLSHLRRRAKNQGASHLPVVKTARAQAVGQVSVEVSAPVEDSGDRIDYMWLKDAETGEVILSKKIGANEAPTLTSLIAKSRRVVPLVHSSRDGVWEGAAFTAAVGS